jgi:hypothetical protein
MTRIFLKGMPSDREPVAVRPVSDAAKTRSQGQKENGGFVSEQHFSYRGICKHGKVRVMVVDCPEMKKEAAKTVADCIRRGLTVDRVTVEEARKSDMNCPDCDLDRKKSLF